MDNPEVPAEPGLASTLTFRPDPRYTVLAFAGAVVALAAAVLLDDRLGQLLTALAAVVLAAYAFSDVVFSPRLIADASGLLVRSPLLRTRLPWADVEDVRADSRVRYGLRNVTLEVDAGSVLAVFSRRALSADPEQAAQAIRALRPH